MLAWTLAYYGGYLVDDTYADRVTMCVEYGFEASFKSGWGFDFDAYAGDNKSAPWMNDVFSIFRALSIVANNGPESVGGGGKQLQPPPPPFCTE